MNDSDFVVQFVGKYAAWAAIGFIIVMMVFYISVLMCAAFFRVVNWVAVAGILVAVFYLLLKLIGRIGGNKNEPGKDEIISEIRKTLKKITEKE